MAAVSQVGVTSAAAAAKAAPIYSTGPFFGSGGSGPGQFSTPHAVAVDASSGDILVTDTDNDRVEVLAPDAGAGATYVTEFSTGAGSAPYGIAIDPANGDTYVSLGGSNAIRRYASDGAATPTYTLDATFTSPAAGSGSGQIGNFAAPLAVDPTTHDLLAADPGNNIVDRYTSSGAFVRAIDGTGSPEGGRFQGLLSLAVGPTGETYVVDSTGDVFWGAATSRIVRFTSSGTPDGSLHGVPTPRAVAVDPESGGVVAAGNSTLFDANQTLNEFGTGTTAVASTPYPGSITAYGIAVAPSPSVATSVAYGAVGDWPFGGGTPGVQSFAASGVYPGAEIDAVSSITSRSAHVSGAADSGGDASTTARFEYSSDGGATWLPLSDQPVPSAAGSNPVADDITAVDPNTDYKVHLVVTNGVYTNTTDPVSFSTLVAAPAISGVVASELSSTGARLNGRINPFGLNATYYFEYGTTTSYGSHAPTGDDGVAGAGRSSRLFSQPIKGLTPGTTYHYRLVARNSAGTTTSSDFTFTSKGTALAAPARAYEQVTPVDKQGISLNTLTAFQASVDGNGMAYGANNAPGSSSANGAPLVSRFVSTRSDAGWSSRDVEGPAKAQADEIGFPTIAIADDMSKTLFVSNRKLAYGAYDGGGNLYVRDTRTGSYTFVGGSADPAAYRSFAGIGSDSSYLDGAPDLSWIVFASAYPLTQDATPGVQSFYRWSASGGLKLSSIMPDGTPSATSSTARSSYEPVIHAASQDGSKVFFGNGSGVFVRINDTTTKALSVSQVGGGPAGPQPASLAGISRDGRYAVFVADGVTPLTTDAPTQSGSMYRYDLSTDRLIYLGAGNLSAGVSTLAVSDDAGAVYFESPATLTTDADPAVATHYYVWHDGQIDLVANTNDSQTSRAISPNGRYFAFVDHTKLTSYDNTQGSACSSPCQEVYLYDLGSKSLSCASCPPDGASSNGDANLPGNRLELSNHYPNALNDQGEVFFDSPSKLVAADVNGRRDVYEYSDGEPSLISPGRANAAATFADSSADGRDVFFVTGEALVPQDNDSAFDVYDARIGGGIAGQAPDPARASCQGDECREPVPGPVTSVPAPSQTAAAKGVPVAKASKAKVTIVKATLTKNALHITVRASGRGRIRISGVRLVTTIRSVTRAGPATIVVPLTKSTRKLKHKTRVSIRVSLTPSFGAAATAKTSRTFGK